MATAYTSEVSPILERVAKLASTSGVTLNTATSALGFFSTSNTNCLTLGSVLATASGTTAPFSAMSGAVSVTEVLAAGAPLAPRAFSASFRFLASNAALLKASAYCGNRPVPASRPATTALCLRVCRRVCIVCFS